MSMSNMKINLILCALALTAVSCDLFKIKEDPQPVDPNSTAVARVFQSFLYPEDLEGLTSDATNASDSTDIVDRYVRSWIKKQLLINKAAEEIDFDEAELSRKILDYRYALMVHEYKQLHIDNNLNTDVTEEEIQSYYDDHQDLKVRHI